MKEKFRDMVLRHDTRRRIAQVNGIVEEYQEKGYSLTLRQLYYQLVARDMIPNTVQEYKRLVDVVSDGRLAGLIDWLGIVDRTRGLRSNTHWESPQDLLRSAVEGYANDKWLDQDTRVEVWVEKDALVDVLRMACAPLDVPFFSCRGFTSQSSLWRASKRVLEARHGGQDFVVVHLADHDPSGLSMTEDIDKRFEMFCGGVKVRRVALNMAQVRKYGPPPNPAKESDSRYARYAEEFGEDSWELDALDVEVIHGVITKAVLRLRDEDRWAAAVASEERDRAVLRRVSDRWPQVVKYVGKLKDRKSGRKI